MKRPTTIRVGPFDAHIKPLEGEASDTCMGAFYGPTMTIYMAEKFETDRLEAGILLHEITHAIYYVYGVKRKDKEERVVAQISTGMASVIRDNPELIAWLGKKLS